MKNRIIATTLFVAFALVPVFGQSKGHNKGQSKGQNRASGHVILLGQLKVKAGKEAAFLKVIDEMTARAKREEGNIRYRVFKAAPFGNAPASASTPNFIFIEEWEDQASFDAHGKWAGPMVQSQWGPLTDSMQFLRLTRQAN